ncbi:FecR family protein [Pseudoflavitalea rhizosphaerae]|uniref:FecR family protein n=1 Tax=Pseudoflavitalea rhizosphaerae TaxID=1884793 RepID=UPI000F8C32EA|nr:FecR family protein [Pseudoflavitalea rhizosphaerae]
MQNLSNDNANLWRQYLGNQASKEELDELFRFNAFPDDEQQNVVIELVLAELPDAGSLDADRQEEILQSILDVIGTENKPRVHSLKRVWMAAASVLLLLTAGLYWLMTLRSTDSTVTTDIQPGTNGALLTLADGKQVLLDTIRDATISLQQGVNARVVNGTLVYEQGSAEEIVFNTVTTPKGRQYQLTLSDGTKVWLNADSRIHYPASFSGVERTVDIEGEVYFEVMKSKSVPFRVRIDNRAEVEVLGTNFNVNAYANEDALSATLLEGAVRVHGPSGIVSLKPGQQAQVPASGNIKLNDTADLEKVMAWKNGLFAFENASLQEVMQQLERWYGVDVVYKEEIPDIKFGGMMLKSLTLAEVLRLLKIMAGDELEFNLTNDRILIVSRAKNT